MADEFEREVSRRAILQKIRSGSCGDSERVKVGRYLLEKSLGRGGMGEVYAAEDPELERKVALKLVSKQSAVDREVLCDRLLKDARSAALVTHPHVVEIYDVGTDDGELYVVMELIEQGRTLDDWLAERPRPWLEIVRMFVQAGEGLAAAHSRGLVHRDFKLSNVLVDERGRAKVADFGLARTMEESRKSKDSSECATSASDQVEGTIEYMAPEQWEGRYEPRTDQYAYCVALYRALFREWPRVDTREGEEHDESLSHPVCRPKRRYGAPRALERIVMKGLAPDPKDRHRSMETLLGMMRSLVLRRSKRHLAVGATCVALVAMAIGYFAPREVDACSAEPLWTSKQRQRGAERLQGNVAGDAAFDVLDEFSDDWRDAQQAVCEANPEAAPRYEYSLQSACLGRKRVSFTSVMTRVIDGEIGPKDAIGLVRMIPPVSDCRPEAVLLSKDMERAFAQSTGRSSTPEVEQRWRQLSDRLAEVLARASAEPEWALGEFSLLEREATEANLFHLAAEAMSLRGLYGLQVARDEQERASARSALEKSAVLALEANGHRFAALAIVRWAEAEPRWTDTTVLLSQLETARALARALPLELYSQSLLARIEIARAGLLLDSGQIYEAVAGYKSAQRIAKREFDIVRAYDGLANALLENEERAKARKIWQWLRHYYEHAEPNSPRLMTFNHNLALIAIVEEKFGQALAANKLAEDAYTRSGQKDKQDLLSIRAQRGRILFKQGQHREAAEVLSEVLEGFTEGPGGRGEEGLDIAASAWGVMVDIEVDSGNPQRALYFAEQYLAFIEEKYPGEKVRIALAQADTAQAAASVGDRSRALELGAAAYGAVHDEPDGWDKLNVLFAYAKVTYIVGDLELTRDLILEIYLVFELVPNSARDLEQVKNWAEKRGIQ